MNILNSIFLKFNKNLYLILGPSWSSKLAHSLLGRNILKFTHKGENGLQVYEAIDGIKMLLTKDEALTMGIFYLGMLNPLETRIVKSILKPGDIFIDVGAYIDGWYTLLASRIVGRAGKVISFEPHPEYARRLSQSINFNNFHNIRLENYGLSDKKTQKILYEGGPASSYLKNHTEVLTKTKAKKIKTKLTTLDSYVKAKRIKKVKLIKIDVEGLEVKVLKGGRKFLKSNPPQYLLIEVSDTFLKRAGSNEDELIQILKTHNYDPFMFGISGKLEKYVKNKRNEIYNLLFIHQNKKKYYLV